MVGVSRQERGMQRVPGLCVWETALEALVDQLAARSGLQQGPALSHLGRRMSLHPDSATHSFPQPQHLYFMVIAVIIIMTPLS